MNAAVDELVPRAVVGDQAALVALLEESGPLVREALQRSYRWRLSAEVDLDDVMQVTYMEAFLRIEAFTPGGPGAFGGWLRRIAENNMRDAIRKSDIAEQRRWPSAAARGDSCRGLVELVSGGDSPSRVAGRAEAAGLLEAGLRRLPADYERVLRLYDLKGHSGPEVAWLMGRSHGAIKMLVARARERLAQVLGAGGNFSSHTGAGVPGRAHAGMGGNLPQAARRAEGVILAWYASAVTERRSRQRAQEPPAAITTTA